jgi:hypothetical protein
MFGRIRELYDRSKFPQGSKLQKEANALRALAKKRLMLGLKGAFAVGSNFVGKVRPDGRADLLQLDDTGIFGIDCRIPVDPRKVFHYSEPYQKNYIIVSYGAFETELDEIDNWDEQYGTIRYIKRGLRTFTVRDSTGQVFFSSTLRLWWYHPDLMQAIVAAGLPSPTYKVIVTLTDSGHPNEFRPDKLMEHDEPFEEIFTNYSWDGDLDNDHFGEYQVRAEYTWQTQVGWVTTALGPRYRTYYMSDFVAARNAYYASLLPNVIQANDGEIVYRGSYSNAVYPDDITPTTPPSTPGYSGYDDHLSRHRAWRLSQHQSLLDGLQGGVHKNLALALMADAPYSKIVGIGSRWDGYRVEQTITGVSNDQTHTRRIYARNGDGNEVLLISGTVHQVRIATSGGGRDQYTFDHYPCLRPLIEYAYLNGTNLLTSREQLNFNYAACEGSIFGVVKLDGIYDTLFEGLNDTQAQNYANVLGERIPAPTVELTFSPIDLTPLIGSDGKIPPDILRQDEDIDGDGTIEPGEKSPTSERPWIGKGLSAGERLVVFPLSYIAEDGECGMFPQAHDIARLTAIMIYGSYKFRYDGEGGFEFIDYAPLEVPEAFPYDATATLGCNAIVVASGTGFDDLRKERREQLKDIEGKYDEDMEAGQITLEGLYDWCRQAAIQRTPNE